MIGVDDAQAQYWNGLITRGEAQRVFDEFAESLIESKTKIINLEFIVSYIVEKFGIEPADIEAFATRKMTEFQQKAQEANVDEKLGDFQAKPLVTLN